MLVEIDGDVRILPVIRALATAGLVLGHDARGHLLIKQNDVAANWVLRTTPAPADVTEKPAGAVVAFGYLGSVSDTVLARAIYADPRATEVERELAKRLESIHERLDGLESTLDSALECIPT